MKLLKEYETMGFDSLFDLYIQATQNFDLSEQELIKLCSRPEQIKEIHDIHLSYKKDSIHVVPRDKQTLNVWMEELKFNVKSLKYATLWLESNFELKCIDRELEKRHLNLQTFETLSKMTNK